MHWFFLVLNCAHQNAGGGVALKLNWYFYCINLQKAETCEYKNTNKIPNTVLNISFYIAGW